MEKIIYANGTAEVLVPAGQKIAIATYGNEYATLSFKRGNNLEFIQRLDNAQVTLGPWTDVRTVSIEAAQDPVSYDVGTAPNIESNVRMNSNPLTGRLGLQLGQNLVSPIASFRRSEALVRFQGICKGNTPFNISPSTAAQTYTVKIEVEAPFSGVRMLSDNGAPNAQTVNKLAVGVTETNAVTATTLSASQNMSAPVINGVAYDTALATVGNLGYRQVTWSASNTWGMPAGNAARQYALSDWVPLQSTPRADGGSRPLFLMRQVPDPAGYNFLVASALMRSATAANRGRTIQTSSYFGDGLTTPAGVFSLGTTYTDTYPIFRFNTPVLSVWGVGDSISQGNSTAIIPDGYSSFGARACADASTLARPVVYANLGANGQTAGYYWSQAKALLALGVPAPSVLITGPASVNDGASTPTIATLEAQRDRAYDMISTCRTYGIPAMIWLPVMPNENLTNVSTTFYDDKRKQINAELKAIATAAGIAWLTLDELGDGASPEKWVPAYKYDAFHPNELVHDQVISAKITALLNTINF